MKFSKKITDMQYSPILKFDVCAAEERAKGKKIYALNIGQPDIETPPEFFDAISAFGTQTLKYMGSQGNDALLEAICGYFGRLNIVCNKENFIITNGGSEALMFAFLGILNEDDEVMIAEPFYSNYHSMVKTAGGNITPIVTYAEEGFRYADRERLEASLTEKTRALCIVNPSNPTGALLSKEDMQVIADFAKDHDLWIVADEVYREFAYDGKQMVSFAELEDIKDRLIIVDSISKRFSACGARIGFIMTKNAELYSHLMKLAQSRLCCPTLEQEGATALYNLAPSYFDKTRAEYQRRRDVAYEELSKIEGIVCQKPGGAFYITMKLPVDDAENFLMYMITEFEENGESVMFSPASGFYMTEGKGKDEIRIAYVLKEDDLRRSIQLLAKGIKSYNSKG